jgi:hypothetical protein
MKKMEVWLATTLLGNIFNICLNIAGYLMYFSIFGIVWISAGVILTGTVMLAEYGLIRIGPNEGTLLAAAIMYAFLTTLTTLLGMLHHRLTAAR